MGKTSDAENNKSMRILACCEYLRCRHFESETGSVGGSGDVRKKRQNHLMWCPKLNVRGR